jgi:hypothetical protein
MSVIPATREVEVEGSQSKTLSEKQTKMKMDWGYSSSGTVLS